MIDLKSFKLLKILKHKQEKPKKVFHYGRGDSTIKFLNILQKKPFGVHQIKNILKIC